MSRNIAKIDYLIRLGLGKSEDKLTYYRQAVTDPVKSVTNPQLRGYVAELLDDLLDFVFDDQTTWNRIQTLLQKNKKKNEEEDTAMTDEVEIVEDVDNETNPLQQKLAAQRQQLQKQKAQIRLQLQQKKAQKQIQAMKTDGQKQLAKEDEDLEENSMGYVYDPITKKNVPRKGPKVKVGGGATNNGKDVETGPSKKWSKTDESLDETAVAQEKSGRANYWYRQHTNRYQMYLRNGDTARAEAHRKKAIEYKRRAYDALDNPEKQLKF